MRYVKTILLIFLIIVSFCIVSCDDDEETSTIVQNSSAAKEYFIIGEVLMRPYLELIGDIHPINGMESDIDSIIIEDSSCIIAKYQYFVEGNNYNYQFNYRNRADSLRFTSGDSLLVSIYRGNEICETYVTALRMPDDSVEVISPPDHSTYNLNEAFTLTWSKIPDADWYSILIFYDTSTVPEAEIIRRTDFTVDTTYTVPASLNNYNGSYLFHISAVTGPVPGEPGNLESETISGVIYGHAVPGVSMGLQITIGSGPSKVPTLSTSDLTLFNRQEYISR